MANQQQPAGAADRPLHEIAAQPARAANRPLHEIPVGRQTIALPPEVAQHLARLAPTAWPDLIASRVWFEKKRDQLLLHLGDVAAGRLDE